MATTRSGNRPAKKSTSKPQAAAFPDSKRQKLPLRKKASADSSDPVDSETRESTKPSNKRKKGTASQGEEEVKAEDGPVTGSSVVDASELAVANEIDAALQQSLAELEPETPVALEADKKQGRKKEGAAPAPVAEEEEDSDDEAPEAISNVQAATSAKQAAQASQRAAKEYVLPFLETAGSFSLGPPFHDTARGDDAVNGFLTTWIFLGSPRG